MGGASVASATSVLRKQLEERGELINGLLGYKESGVQLLCDPLKADIMTLRAEHARVKSLMD